MTTIRTIYTLPSDVYRCPKCDSRVRFYFCGDDTFTTGECTHCGFTHREYADDSVELFAVGKRRFIRTIAGDGG